MKSNFSIRKLTIRRLWIPLLWALAAQGWPLFADTVIVESRSGGQNYSAYSDSGNWGNSTAKSTAAGCTGGIGSRYTYTASPAPSFTVRPILGVVAGEYAIDTTLHQSACPDIVVNVTASGGTLSVSSTTAFRTNDPDTWKRVGTITLDSSVNNPTVTFTYSSGSLCGSASTTCGRFYADAVRFVYLGDPCVNALPELTTVNGPLAAGQNYVDVPGVANMATAVYVYADGERIGSLTDGVVGGTNRVPTTALVQGNVITVTQADSSDVESCRPTTGPIVGGGANPRIRVAVSIRQNTALNGPIGADGTSATAPLKFLGASGVVGGGYGNAPLDGKIIYPGGCWQTVTFERGVDVTYPWASSDNNSNILGNFGVLESIAFAIDDLSSSGPFKIYLDNIMNGSTVIQDFESASNGQQTVLFSSPGASGSTSPFLLSPAPGAISPNISEVSSEYAETGLNSALISWQFKDCAAPDWLRLITQGTLTPNPQVDLRLPISFRILVLPIGGTTTGTPVTASGPTNEIVFAGDSVTLSPIVTGGPVTYRWLKDEVAITSETGASLSMPEITFEQSGTYCVEINGPCNSVTNYATVTVHPRPRFSSCTYDAASGRLSLTIPTSRGVALLLEYTDSLSEPAWNGLEAIYGDGNPLTLSYEVEPNSPQRFYRLSVMQVIPGLR